MPKYSHILLAADFDPDDDNPVVARAQEIARSTGAQLSLVHVIEYPYNYGAPYEIPTLIEWQKEVETAAKQQMNALGDKLAISRERRYLEVGIPKSVILEVAERIGADLIILGSHGRHGLNLLLLGSTANAILHGAKCDVLAVRVGLTDSKAQEK